MKTAPEIRTGIGVVVSAQMIVAFASIGLVTRMSPAIERILYENVRSTTAVEQMYGAIARRECGLAQAEAEASFDEALAAEKANITVDGEGVLVDEVDQLWRRGMAGDCDAMDVVTRDLDGIAALNRGEMSRQDLQAKRLGAAGAWATVLLGLATFGISAMISRRFIQRIAYPISEIEAVLVAANLGDPYRRCRRLDGPAEFGAISMRLNQLLDKRLAQDETEDPQLRATDRCLLQHLLDRMPDAVVAVDRSGAVIAASDRAMDVIAGSGVNSLADALAISPDGDPEISLIQRVEPFGKQQGFLVWLRPLETMAARVEHEAAAAAGTAAPIEPLAAILSEPLVRKPTLSTGLADRGASDDPNAKTVPVEPRPTDGKPDWKRD